MTTLVVVSHPDPGSLTQEIARTVSTAIRAAGGTVELADLEAEGFDPRFERADLEVSRGNGAPSAPVLAEQQRIDRADSLVLVFPVYWWSMPALLKGWIDRVFANGWAYRVSDTGEFTKGLDRLHVHLVPIAGDGAAGFERHGMDLAFRTQIERGIFEYCGATVASTSFVFDADTKGHDLLAAEISALTADLVDHLTAAIAS